MAVGTPDEEVDNTVAFTCRYTAGLRAVENERAAEPIVRDNIAKHLAGPKGLELARDEWDRLSDMQGPGKHLRVPARTRIIDDKLSSIVQSLSGQGKLQVVSLGAGMDTRPWRLELSGDVSWFDVDQPTTVSLKQKLLADAKVATTSAANSENPAFPLLYSSWTPIPLDLSKTNMTDALLTAGFDSSCLTVWVAEALLYYLHIPEACDLLKTLAKLSSPGSFLIATCVDQELYDACWKLDEKHLFSKLWFYEIKELLSQTDVFPGVWTIIDAPNSTFDLALSLYGMETYVAAYGGAEEVFTAKLSC